MSGNMYEDPFDDPHWRDTKKTSSRGKRADRFIGCPVSWFQWVVPLVKSKEQLIVALWLYRQSRICGSPTVTVPTKGLQHLGIGRWAKYKLLPALQQAGVLTIERRSGRAIKVTLTHWPDAPECRTWLDGEPGANR
jgi:hypothetical protein